MLIRRKFSEKLREKQEYTKKKKCELGKAWRNKMCFQTDFELQEIGNVTKASWKLIPKGRGYKLI